MRPGGDTTDGSVPNPRESTVDTEPPPPGGAYSAETVVRSVPRELLRELNYPLKPPKVPTIEAQPAETSSHASDKNVSFEIDVPAAPPATSDMAIPPLSPPAASSVIAPTYQAPSPARHPAPRPPPRSVLSGWSSLCLIFVVAIAVIALWFGR